MPRSNKKNWLKVTEAEPVEPSETGPVPPRARRESENDLFSPSEYDGWDNATVSISPDSRPVFIHPDGDPLTPLLPAQAALTPEELRAMVSSIEVDYTDRVARLNRSTAERIDAINLRGRLVT